MNQATLNAVSIMESILYILGGIVTILTVVTGILFYLSYKDAGLWTSCITICFVVIGIFGFIQKNIWERELKQSERSGVKAYPFISAKLDSYLDDGMARCRYVIINGAYPISNVRVQVTTETSNFTEIEPKFIRNIPPGNTNSIPFPIVLKDHKAPLSVNLKVFYDSDTSDLTKSKSYIADFRFLLDDPTVKYSGIDPTYTDFKEGSFEGITDALIESFNKQEPGAVFFKAPKHKDNGSYNFIFLANEKRKLVLNPEFGFAYFAVIDGNKLKEMQMPVNYNEKGVSQVIVAQWDHKKALLAVDKETTEVKLDNITDE